MTIIHNLLQVSDDVILNMVQASDDDYTGI